MGFRQPAVSAGQGEGDCLAVLPLARSPARASALARTTSGSRGSGGRASCQGRSCRALGRWIRICCTVSHLPVLISPVSHPSRGGNGGQPGPGGPALLGTVRGPAAVGRHPKVAAGWNVAVRRSVTRRCYSSMSWAMRWFDLPASSSRSTSRRLRVAGDRTAAGPRLDQHRLDGLLHHARPGQHPFGPAGLAGVVAVEVLGAEHAADHHGVGDQEQPADQRGLAVPGAPAGDPLDHRGAAAARRPGGGVLGVQKYRRSVHEGPHWVRGCWGSGPG